MLRRAITLALACATLLGAGKAGAALAPSAASPELRPLTTALGHWIYRGQTFATRFTKAGKWGWIEDCGWSHNDEFLICTFVMNWPEGPNQSVSVTTYNKVDKAYWHYEIIDDEHGNKPVVSRMRIDGDTWTETSENINANGKIASRFRVTYTYTSPSTARVTFESSKDGRQWMTLARGVGTKQP